MRRSVRLGKNRVHRWCVFLKRVVDSIRMIIGDVILEETAQVYLVEYRHVIQKVSATASDPAFRNSILPWTCDYQNSIRNKSHKHLKSSKLAAVPCKNSARIENIDIAGISGQASDP
jgi:hypothetical protein